MRYDLKFLDDAEARPTKGEPAKWFKVGDVLTLDDAGPKMLKEVMNRGLENTEAAYQRLYDLHQAVRVHKPMNYYLVKDQDANKVLEIFVRVNSGGTPLSYSDLLLSMATNQWEELDAREEVRELVQELNTGGTRQFSFSKDVVLKSALMIAGVDLRFRVSNFTQENMAKVEKAWPEIENALTRAANLLRQFGFTDQTLTADSVIVPIAYYFHRRGLGDAYLDSGKDAADRQEVQKWVTRSLIKRGVWGSGLDTALTRIRSAMDSNTEPMFPVEAIEVEMSGAGKSLAFEETEIDELLSLKYGGRRTFAVLSILYPGLDFGKSFHQDHVFPKSRFTPKRLIASGVPADRVDDFREAFNLLPNLQLLVGAANVEKQSAEPSAWLESHLFLTLRGRPTWRRTTSLDCP